MDPFTLRIIFQISLAAMLGFVVGLEREVKGKPAGMRTYALVAMGATLFTVLSVEGFAGFITQGYDPSRIASQIVVGIGFIGAGLIFVQKNSVRGLTTAASVWTVAAVGVAVGLQFYLVAIYASVLTLFILWVLRKFEDRLDDRLGDREEDE